MKKLRDNPIASRSSYTRDGIAEASDVIDTTDAAPNTMPDSVSSERSLCPRISRSASRISSAQSRIAQRFDGSEPGGPQRREQPGDQAHGQRGADGHRRDERTDDRGHLHEVGNDSSECGPESQSQESTNDRDDEDLGEHVGEDPARGRAQRHAGSELADTLPPRREQDVRDHDPARDERDHTHDEENEVEQQQEPARFLARPLPRYADIEVFHPVPREEQAAALG